jgi:hypothetical protein
MNLKESPQLELIRDFFVYKIILKLNIKSNVSIN